MTYDREFILKNGSWVSNPQEKTPIKKQEMKATVTKTSVPSSKPEYGAWANPFGDDPRDLASLLPIPPDTSKELDNLKEVVRAQQKHLLALGEAVIELQGDVLELMKRDKKKTEALKSLLNILGHGYNKDEWRY